LIIYTQFAQGICFISLNLTGPFGELRARRIDHHCPHGSSEQQTEEGPKGWQNTGHSHVLCFQTRIAGYNCIRRSAHRQMKGQAAGQGSGKSQCDGMHFDRQGLNSKFIKEY